MSEVVGIPHFLPPVILFLLLSESVADLEMVWLFPPSKIVNGAVPGIGRAAVLQLRMDDEISELYLPVKLC